GDDLNKRHDGLSSRYVVNYWDKGEDECKRFQKTWQILVERVKPYRSGLTKQVHDDCFWKFWDRREAFFDRVALRERMLVASKCSKHFSLVFGTPQSIYSEEVKVFDASSYASFGTLQSTIHVVWALHWGSQRGGTPRYVGSRCFDTFPFPICFGVGSVKEPTLLHQDSLASPLSNVASEYYKLRDRLMQDRLWGLTSLYNHFHSHDEPAADIHKLRDLHIEMDKAVAAAYGWDDLDLGHGFHETKQGTRYTISESARREVLSRLLKLNHERYAEEVKQGLHDKKGKAKPASSGRGRKTKTSTDTPSLKFGHDDEDDPSDDSGEAPTPTRTGTSPKATRADRSVQPTPTAEPPARPTPIDEIDTDDIMAAFRQAARNRGWLDRDELLKEVSLALRYQRLGPKIDEVLRCQLGAAIRRRIIETDGPNLVRAGTVSMADYEPDELVEVFRSVMRTGTRYDREEVILALARHFGFVRLTETIREPISEAITHAICHRLLGYEGSVIWRKK